MLSLFISSFSTHLSRPTLGIASFFLTLLWFLSFIPFSPQPTPPLYGYMCLFLALFQMDWGHSPYNLRVQIFWSCRWKALSIQEVCLVHLSTSRVYQSFFQGVNQMSCSDCFLFKERKFTTMRERRERESILGKLAPSHNHLCWPLCLFLHHF